MPYPTKATNRNKKGAGQGSQNHAKGATRKPTGFTGRLVTEEGSATSHWLPDANKTGQHAWKCDGCGRWFHWSVDRQRWEPGAAASAAS
jgi:hypothetical protein